MTDSSHPEILRTFWIRLYMFNFFFFFQNILCKKLRSLHFQKVVRFLQDFNRLTLSDVVKFFFISKSLDIFHTLHAPHTNATKNFQHGIQTRMCYVIVSRLFLQREHQK